MIKLRKIVKGCYEDTISHRWIEKKDDVWVVYGEVKTYFTGKTLKECKEYQKQRNDGLYDFKGNYIGNDFDYNN